MVHTIYVMFDVIHRYQYMWTVSLKFSFVILFGWNVLAGQCGFYKQVWSFLLVIG